jgi:hypothetical protein
MSNLLSIAAGKRFIFSSTAGSAMPGKAGSSGGADIYQFIMNSDV